MILTKRLGIISAIATCGKTVVQRPIANYSTGPSTQHILHQVKKYFKNDYSLYNKINLIESLSEGNVRLRIGVVTNELRNKKFLETLLVDPFDTRSWYNDLKNRDLSKNNLIRIGLQNELEIQDEVDVYDIPPSSINDNLRFENIEFLEINNVTNNEHEIRIKGADTLVDKTATQQIPPANDLGCHLYIFIKSSSFEELPNDERFTNWPILTILNSNGHSSSDLVVDLDSAYKANELLIESASLSSAYLDLILHSNFSHFVQSLNEKLNSRFLTQELIKSVINQLYSQLSQEVDGEHTNISVTNYYKTKLGKLDALQNELNSQVSDWEQDSHLELQKQVKVYCDKLTNPSFAEIVKILFKVDDLNVIYENQILTHGFLTDSDRKFNHLVGKIGQDKEVVNAYDNLKQSLALEQLPLLQNSIHDQILKSFGLIQLPTIAVCTVFHIFYNFEVNTLMAIVSLGIVLSLNNISKTTLRDHKKFDTWYMDASRASIEENGSRLRQLLTDRIESEKAVLTDQFDTIKQLELKCESR